MIAGHPPNGRTPLHDAPDPDAAAGVGARRRRRVACPVAARGKEIANRLPENARQREPGAPTTARSSPMHPIHLPFAVLATFASVIVPTAPAVACGGQVLYTAAKSD